MSKEEKVSLVTKIEDQPIVGRVLTDQLTTEKLEILCNLNAVVPTHEVESVTQHQREQLHKLVNRYKGGYSSDVGRDENKITQYKNAALKLTNKQGDQLAPETEAVSARVNNALIWYTTARIFLAWTYNSIQGIGAQIKQDFVMIPQQAKHNFFAVAGFSYAFDVMSDMAVLLEVLLRDKTEDEVDLTRWEMMKRVMTPEFGSHLFNAVVWLAVNVSCFFLTGGWSLVVQSMVSGGIAIAGFVIDVVHAWVAKQRAVKVRETLLQDVQERIDHLNELDPSPERDAELSWLNARVASLQEEIKTAKEQRLISVTSAVIYLVGFGLAILSTIPKLFVMSTAAVVGIVGTMIVAAVAGFGFGKRIYDKHFKKPAKKGAITTDSLSPELKSACDSTTKICLCLNCVGSHHSHEPVPTPIVLSQLDENGHVMTHEEGPSHQGMFAKSHAKNDEALLPGLDKKKWCVIL